MAASRDVIHQIEFRWHQVRDLSPSASTLSRQATAAWGDHIRAWVRQPDADGLTESVCYHIAPTGAAALAWRSRNSRAAERADGSRGRPLITRVLIGRATMLTPEVAIVLCLTGLPDSARPGQVTAPDELPVISPDELTALVTDRAAELDVTAAQAPGLAPVVAAALSDPDSPLAIYLPEPVIGKPVRESPQGLLLWGLRRIMLPLPGAGRRSWSFSTFELPLGAQDTATLPDIVFRQILTEPPPPGVRRNEVKVRPLDPRVLADLRPADVDIACRLVSAYHELGPAGPERLAAGDGRDEHRDASRRGGEETLHDVFGVLDARPQPVLAAEPTDGQDPPDEILAGPRPPEQEQEAGETPSWEEEHTGRHQKAWEGFDSNGAGQASPPMILGDQRQRPTAIGDVLRRMPQADDPAALREMLRFIFASRADADAVERQEARRIMAEDGWYESIAEHTGLTLAADDLAGIFQIIVIRDLGKDDVSKRIGDWTDRAAPAMIGGLLIAATNASLGDRAGFRPRLKKDKDPLDQVRLLMLPRLASRCARELGVAKWWEDDRLP